jgi:hypothetical protein
MACLLILACTANGWALSSTNIPLDSPLYGYLDKLAGMGLITSDMHDLRPYSKAEVARLLLEAEANFAAQTSSPPFARDLIQRVRELVPREEELRAEPEKKPPVLDWNPVNSLRMRYVYLDGIPRDYNRPVFIRGGQSAFGFIGGKLRPDSDAGVLYDAGTEGTPMMENNDGVVYRRGNNGELRWSAEGYLSDKASALVEPMVLASSGDTTVRINRGYVKLGGGGLELLAGRDENWFGPGYRGALTLSNNASNFDQVKLSSPEPLDVAWVKRWLGETKYALIVSRFDDTNQGTPQHRRPWFIGAKLAFKPRNWFEWGINFARM